MLLEDQLTVGADEPAWPFESMDETLNVVGSDSAPSRSAVNTTVALAGEIAIDTMSAAAIATVAAFAVGVAGRVNAPGKAAAIAAPGLAVPASVAEPLPWGKFASN